MLASATTTDKLLVQPLWISRELVLCEAPRHPPGEFSIEMTFGNGAFSTGSGLTYTYDADTHIRTSNLTHLSLSANRMGVRIGLTGLHFLDTPDLAVRVGDQV